MKLCACRSFGPQGFDGVYTPGPDGPGYSMSPLRGLIAKSPLLRVDSAAYLEAFFFQALVGLLRL